jgi:hypothetical protein
MRVASVTQKLTRGFRHQIEEIDADNADIVVDTSAVPTTEAITPQDDSDPSLESLPLMRYAQLL